MQSSLPKSIKTTLIPLTSLAPGKLPNDVISWNNGWSSTSITDLIKLTTQSLEEKINILGNLSSLVTQSTPGAPYSIPIMINNNLASSSVTFFEDSFSFLNTSMYMLNGVPFISQVATGLNLGNTMSTSSSIFIGPRTPAADRDNPIFSTAVGYNSNSLLGSYCTSLGYKSGECLGDYNISIGYNTSGEGSSVICIGNNTKNKGHNNIIIGNDITTSLNNSTIIGGDNLIINLPKNKTSYVLHYNPITKSITYDEAPKIIYNDLNYNTAYGYNTCKNITGKGNSAFGCHSLTMAVDSSNNSAFGDNTLSSLLYGIDNSAFGYDSLSSTTTSSFNTAVGTRALKFNNANENTAVGVNSQLNNINGSKNTSMGSNSLSNNKYGNNNVSVGSDSLRHSLTNNNSSLGANALTLLTTGSDNLALGYNSLHTLVNGSNNISVGSSTTTNSNNILLGNNIQCDGSNRIVIGHNAISTKDNSLTIAKSINNISINLQESETNNILYYNPITSSITYGKPPVITSFDNITINKLSFDFALTHNVICKVPNVNSILPVILDNSICIGNINYESNSNSVHLGVDSGISSTGYNNISIGYRSLFNLTTGNNNICIGRSKITTQNNNILIGGDSLVSDAIVIGNIIAKEEKSCYISNIKKRIKGKLMCIQEDGMIGVIDNTILKLLDDKENIIENIVKILKELII